MMYNKKNKLFILVKWIEDRDNLYSVIKRSELFEPIENELEINAIYKAKYGKDACMAELLYIGNKAECEKVINSLIKQRCKSSKKDSIDMSNDRRCSIVSKSTILDESKKKQEQDNNTVESYLKQLEDRNQLLETLKRQNEEDKQTILSLKDQLEMYNSICDKDFIRKIVLLSIQVLKHLGTPSVLDEIKKISLNNGKIILSNNFKTVLVDECFLIRIQMMIDQNKSNKVVFKSMMTALIPDVLTWGKNNCAFMRTNYSDIINAAKDFLNSKKLPISDSVLKLCLREVCYQSKVRIEKSLESGSNSSKSDDSESD